MGVHFCPYLVKEDTELVWDVDATDVERERRGGDYLLVFIHDKRGDSISEWRLMIRGDEVHIKFCPWCGLDLMQGRDLPLKPEYSAEDIELLRGVGSDPGGQAEDLRRKERELESG